MKFDFDWPIGFRGKDVLSADDHIGGFYPVADKPLGPNYFHKHKYHVHFSIPSQHSPI